jgi:SH3-like domain-containing protein
MTMMKKIAIGAAAALMLTGSAYAQTMVTASTNLNVRSGPGSEHPVVGMIDVNSQATVQACQEGGNWCQVSYRGTEGWVHSRYLATADQVIITERSAGAPQLIQARSGAALNVGAGVVGGGIAGLIIGGPIGAAVGVVAGAGLGAVTAH